MLKITVIDNAKEQKLVLEGKLVDPWVAELKRTWHSSGPELHGRRLVVDLRGVTTISQGGENLLLEMVSDGARFDCSGVMNQHVIRRVKHKHKKSLCGPGWE